MIKMIENQREKLTYEWYSAVDQSWICCENNQRRKTLWISYKSSKAWDKKIIIFCTTPVMKVVVEAEIKNVLEMSPEKLWKKTNKYGGISKDRFFDYFEGHDKAYAYELEKVKVYRKEKSLAEFGCKSAPQSFVYVDWLTRNGPYWKSIFSIWIRMLEWIYAKTQSKVSGTL